MLLRNTDEFAVASNGVAGHVAQIHRCYPLRISHHHFQQVLLADFLTGLVGADLKVPEHAPAAQANDAEPEPALEPDEPITIARLIARLNRALSESMVVIADVGDALFASTELVIHRQTEFLSPAYYASMGFAVPAALGVMVARPDLRPVVLVGDGAFQMTGMELSTIVRHGFAPIVIVLDNAGYGTERLLHAGDHRFNEVHPWRYHKVPEVLGCGTGYEVRTEGDFDRALRAALADAKSMSLLHVHLDPSDSSNALKRLAESLSPNV